MEKTAFAMAIGALLLNCIAAAYTAAAGRWIWLCAHVVCIVLNARQMYRAFAACSGCGRAVPRWSDRECCFKPFCQRCSKLHDDWLRILAKTSSRMVLQFN